MNDFLGELFASKVRAAVLEQILVRPHLGFSLTDLSRLLALPISSLQHECYKLERIGLFVSSRAGNARLYRVNRECPFVSSLTTLVVTAIGQDAALRAVLEGVEGIEVAVLAADLPLTEIDREPGETIPLVLIGTIDLDALTGIQERAETVLGLPPGKIETVYYLPSDWEERLAQGAAYAMWLLSGPRSNIVASLPGDPDQA